VDCGDRRCCRAFPALFLLALRTRFNPAPPQIEFPVPADALEAQRQDVTQFSRLMALDRSFSPSARAEANRRIASLQASPAPLDQPHFGVALMEIAALADNAHTQPNIRGDVFPSRFPIRLTQFSDGVFVMLAKDAASDLLGARVEEIEGRPVSEIIATLEKLQGGVESWRQRLAVIYMALFPEILYATGLAESAAQTRWTFRTPDGAFVERTLAAELARVQGRAPRRIADFWLAPEPRAGATVEWRTLATNERTLPWALRELELGFRRVRLDNSCILAVQMKAIADRGSIKISEFLRSTEADMRANPTCALIMDLRFSVGGSSENTYAFARRLPELMAPGAPVYVLTSSQTISAAITTTAGIKQAMGPRAIILGEPVGDRLAFWAEGNEGCLPHSKLCFAYATGKHDYTQRCWDWRECFWLNWFYPVRVDSLAPDETIAMSFADYMAGRDPVFERAVTLAGEAVP
jgi:hypothetical protein